jgi:hypothetical protein
MAMRTALGFDMLRPLNSGYVYPKGVVSVIVEDGQKVALVFQKGVRAAGEAK